ncbi:DUF4292 domain-containing protein [Emticicia sp. BO119]|uniref:DUF4292 domain-containing protein n=1 Tax=Emticicia sp. BO119 TaxID=2757768 RepID=UPI0015EFE770|nr:DUF4292 domain-containing protein [Emticicia sp. BO119]MBA4853719.1 DUF4292 domain-containing protein [Emticicia sp. BO119]
MSSRYIFLTFSCLIVLFTTSCKRQRIHKTEIKDSTSVAISPTDISVKTDSISAANTSAITKVDVAPAEIDFKFLKLRSKIDYSSGSESQSFPVTVHIEKDNKIWLSISVGLEAARGLITQDSIIFLDRLHRTYYKYDFVTLSRQFNFNLSYDLVQSILIGNMPVKKREEDEITKQDGSFVIRQKENAIQIENIIMEPNLKLQKLLAADTSGGSKMQIDYSNFLAVNNFLFPQAIIAKIDAPKDDKTNQTLINLQHNRIEFLEESPGFSFSIPKGYSPK